MSVELELAITAVILAAIVAGAATVLWLGVEALVWLILHVAKHLTK